MNASVRWCLFLVFATALLFADRSFGAVDADPPVLTSISARDRTLAASEKLIIDFTATDATGVGQAVASFRTPTGNMVYAYLVSGTNRLELTISPNLPNGVYTIYSIQIYDSANPSNAADYRPGGTVYRTPGGTGSHDLDLNSLNFTKNLTGVDTVPPTILGIPDDISGEAGPGASTAVVTWTAPTATDNDAIASLTSTHRPGDTFPLGVTPVTYTATDTAGNVATAAFNVRVLRASTTLLASSSSVAGVGRPVTLTARVQPKFGGPAPTGVVAFYDGSNYLGSRGLASGTATLTTAALSYGPHRLTAKYRGTSTYAESTSSIGVTMRHLATASLTVSSRLSKPLERVTFTARVTSNSGSPIGTVSFIDGTRVLARVPLSGGSASYTTAALAYGRHVISASYNGSPSHLHASSSPSSVLVTYALGAQTRVNITPALSTTRPVASSLADGGAAIVWESQPAVSSPVGIVARRVSKLGVMSPVEIQVAPPAAGLGSPYVAGLTNGDFVIVWHEGAPGRRNVYARAYANTGTPRGAAFLVNSGGVSENVYPRVAPLANGAFLITWQSTRADSSGFGIVARRFNTNRLPSAGQFRVNTTEIGNQTYAAPLRTANGNLVIAWAGTVTGGHSIFLQLFRPDGTRIGPERRLNSEPMTAVSRVAATPLANGAFALAWTSPESNATSPTDVYLQRFQPNGLPAGANIRINVVTLGRQQDAMLTTIAGNNLVSTWTGIDGGLPVTPGIEAHVLRPTGARVSMPFGVNTTTSAIERYPTIASYNSGSSYLIAWSVHTPSQPGEIYLQRFTGTLHDSVRQPSKGPIGNDARALVPH